MSPTDLSQTPAPKSPTPKSPSRGVARSQSISSDRTSLTGYGSLLSPPATISPDAAFIAASAASQIVTNDHDSRGDTWFDQHGIEPSGETALVAAPALKLVNKFLDQLLFNFLSVSKSTSLATLRPAVAEVLKTKLAKDAIQGADQELHEYLGGGEDEELMSVHNEKGSAASWDQELIWKRTRLRCMVYSSLGDMEEEDEDFYTAQEQLDGPSGSSYDAGIVSPAVAIFLTSILEHMGEQVLVVAGQSAYNRLRAKHEKEEKDGTNQHGDIADRVVVTELDMERVALDRTLGRLWRGWKKRIRSPNASVSLPRSFSRDSVLSQNAAASSDGPEPEVSQEDSNANQSLATVLAEFEHAATVPLPIADDDVREIEVPGLVFHSDDEDADIDSDDDLLPIRRPRSWVIFTSGELPALESPTTQKSTSLVPGTRKRSHSVPSRSPFALSAKRFKPSTETNDTKDVADTDAGVGKEVDTPDTETVIKSVDEHVDSKDANVEEIGTAGIKSRESTIDETASLDQPISQEAKDLKTDEMPEPAVPSNATETETGAEELQTGDEAVSSKPVEDKGLIAGVVTGAAVIGTAAVAGIITLAKGKSIQTEPETDESELDEEVMEEPQIMTSSRVSIGGRASPDNAAVTTVSRSSSVRAPSVHSLRLIDVTAPKSPGRSRTGSVDTVEHYVPRPPSRPNSVHGSPLEQVRMGSPISRGYSTSPVARNGSSLSGRHVRTSTELSIEEETLDDSTQPPTDTIEAASASETPQDLPVRDRPLDNRHHFVLSAPPATQKLRELNKQHTNGDGHTSNYGLSKPIGVENGVPPLTPVHETLEGAGVSSDDASDASVSIYSRTPSEVAARSRTPTVSGSTIPQLSKGHQDPLRSQPVTVTRQVPPRSSPPRTSPTSSFNEETSKRIATEKRQRSGRSSGSSSSNTSHKLRPVRTSEENTSTYEDKGQSFEQLIRSDQTIQYTLTPQNMRDIESPDSPRHMAPTIVANGFGDARRPPSGRSHSSSFGKAVTRQSHSPVELPKSPKSPKLVKSFKPIPRQAPAPVPAPSPVPAPATKSRANQAQPRDARVDRDSMHDFAEFIRSTGPANSYSSPPARSAPAQRPLNGNARNTSASASRVGETTNGVKRTDSAAGRSRLQARDAVVPRGDSISDLIDFVRSGPQLEKNGHRIPRTVAPFRTTMDSDQMSGAVGGKAVDATLPSPRYSQTTAASLNSSVNSQSALLNGSNSKPSIQDHTDFNEQDMIPKRKQRRVRDPYAIDLSEDEDEFDAFTRSKPKPIQEESLADFLKNVPPPPEAAATPIFQSAQSTGKNVKKKSSATSFRSRFSRKDSATHTNSKPKSSHSGDSRSINSQNGARKVPTHTPIAAQYSTTLASYEPSRSNDNYVSQVDSARKVVQNSYKPREAVVSANRTGELADFLRSQPPTSSHAEPQTFVPALQKEEGALQRMFGRKKAQT